VQNLTLEGIESNPVPSWDDFLGGVKKKYPTDYDNLFLALQKLRADLLSKLEPKPLAVTTTHIKNYLKGNAEVIEQLQLTIFVPNFLGIISTLEGFSIGKDVFSIIFFLHNFLFLF
jgi:hypothetical protein